MAHILIDTYFDYASPYAYIALSRLDALAERHEVAIDWKPIRLSGLPSFANGDPYSVSKRKYMAQDAMRSALFHGVPIQPPHPSPVRSDTSLAVALVCQEAGIFADYHRAVFEAAWGHQRDISDFKVLGDCISAAGGNPSGVLASAKSSVVRAQLTALQVDAESKGIFGVPTMVMDGELFWGADQIPVLEWRVEQMERKALRRRVRPNG